MTMKHVSCKRFETGIVPEILQYVTPTNGVL